MRSGGRRAAAAAAARLLGSRVRIQAMAMAMAAPGSRNPARQPNLFRPRRWAARGLVPVRDSRGRAPGGRAWLGGLGRAPAARVDSSGPAVDGRRILPGSGGRTAAESSQAMGARPGAEARPRGRGGRGGWDARAHGARTAGRGASRPAVRPGAGHGSRRLGWRPIGQIRRAVRVGPCVSRPGPCSYVVVGYGILACCLAQLPTIP